MRQVELYPTNMGDIEAIKADRDEPWHISHPWGDERFHGSRTEVRTRCKEIVEKNDPCE